MSVGRIAETLAMFQASRSAAPVACSAKLAGLGRAEADDFTLIDFIHTGDAFTEIGSLRRSRMLASASGALAARFGLPSMPRRGRQFLHTTLRNMPISASFAGHASALYWLQLRASLSNANLASDGF